METTKGIIKNLDTFEGIEPLTKNDMCLYRVRAMERAYGLTAEGGSMMCWSNTLNKWVMTYDWHYWCVDENGDLWDSHNALKTSGSLCPNGKWKKPNKFNYLLINANDFTHFGSLELGLSSYEKWANKYIPKSKYDYIYVYGFAAYDGIGVMFEDDLYNFLYEKDDLWNLESQMNAELTEKIIQNILAEQKKPLTFV
jgi:hypothetical protein